MVEIRYNNQCGQLGTSLDAPSAGTSQVISNLFPVVPDFATLAPGDYFKLVFISLFHVFCVWDFAFFEPFNNKIPELFVRRPSA